MDMAGTRDIAFHSGTVPGNPGHLVTLIIGPMQSMNGCLTESKLYGSHAGCSSCSFVSLFVLMMHPCSSCPIPSLSTVFATLSFQDPPRPSMMRHLLHSPPIFHCVIGQVSAPYRNVLSTRGQQGFI